MNPVERVVRVADRWQQRHTPTAFVFGVIKKYGDDNAGQMAASLSYTAFVSLFPLLLVLTTVLGLVAASNPSLRHTIISAVAGQFPVIKHQLTHNVHQLRRASYIGLVIGLVAALWGAAGLAQSGIYTMVHVWNLPGPERPGYFQRLGRAGLFLLVLVAGVAASTLLTAFSSFVSNSVLMNGLAELLATAVNVGMYVLGFRVLTPKSVPIRSLLPGAVLAGIGWTILLAAGSAVVGHYLHSDSVYGIFAIVLSLVAWIYLVVEVTIYSAEVNVVLARRLWPRSIVQPPLTDADREALALFPLAERRREEQHVAVTYTDQPGQVTPEPVGKERGDADADAAAT
ncbi:MAG: YihY/virulence factor BrkB family protein [Streptosporangiaceae bacterium]